MRISPSEVKRIKATTEYNRIQQNTTEHMARGV